MPRPHHYSTPAPAPNCPPVRWWHTWHCSIAGRRDAPSVSPNEETGHLPFTQNLHAQAHRGEAETSRWLHQQVSGIDQQIVTLCSGIARRQQILPTQIARATAGTSPLGTLERTRAAQQGRRLDDRRLQQAADLGRDIEQLAGLIAIRRHTIEQARDIAAVFVSRYDQLVACHRRGYLRRRRDDSLTASTWPVPRFTPTLPWVNGDLPLLATSIDPATREVVEWAMREFDTTSDRTHLYAI